MPTNVPLPSSGFCGVDERTAMRRMDRSAAAAPAQRAGAPRVAGFPKAAGRRPGEVKDTLPIGYRPSNRAGRFSRKARVPSR